MSGHAKIAKLRRHAEYYIRGGDVTFLAGDCLFRVHRYFFERESAYFQTHLNGLSPGQPQVGTDDANAFHLDGVGSEEFEKFLWVFYNPLYSLYDREVEDWADILRLAYQWQFAQVYALSVRELEKKVIDHVPKISLYQRYGVDDRYLIPAFAAVCSRPEPLTDDEGESLGLRTALLIARAREVARASPSAEGVRSPSAAGLGLEDLQMIIFQIFKITTEPLPEMASNPRSLPPLIQTSPHASSTIWRAGNSTNPPRMPSPTPAPVAPKPMNGYNTSFNGHASMQAPIQSPPPPPQREIFTPPPQPQPPMQQFPSFTSPTRNGNGSTYAPVQDRLSAAVNGVKPETQPAPTQMHTRKASDGQMSSLTGAFTNMLGAKSSNDNKPIENPLSSADPWASAPQSQANPPQSQQQSTPSAVDKSSEKPAVAPPALPTKENEKPVDNKTTTGSSVTESNRLPQQQQQNLPLSKKTEQNQTPPPSSTNPLRSSARSSLQERLAQMTNSALPSPQQETTTQIPSPLAESLAKRKNQKQSNPALAAPASKKDDVVKAKDVGDAQSSAGTGLKKGESGSVHKENGDVKQTTAAVSGSGDALDADYTIVGSSPTPTLVPDDHANDEGFLLDTDKATKDKTAKKDNGKNASANSTGSKGDGKDSKDTAANRSPESPGRDFVDVGAELAKARIMPPSRPTSALSTLTNDKFYDAVSDAEVTW